jgi:hypothetical protein
MRDANDRLVPTVLWPLRYPLSALLKHKKLVCYMGALHGFLDLRGLLAEDKGREFLDLRQYAINVFVKHCAETFDEATVVSVVADAEEELFKIHLALTEASKKN